jgi:hypothetical protein
MSRLRGRIQAADEAMQRLRGNLRTRARLGLPLAVLDRYAARQGVLLASATAFRLFLWLVPLALLIAGILAALDTTAICALRRRPPASPEQPASRS